MTTPRSQHLCQSSVLGEAYPIWITEQREDQPVRLCLFLDGEIYRDRVQAEEFLAGWNRRSDHPFLTGVFLSYIDQLHRHRDFICHAGYAKFLVAELLPFLEQQIGSEGLPPILIGLSLSGLAAIHTASLFPDRFSCIISQSPSAWWNDEWLTAELRSRPAVLPRTWLSVGLRETEEDVCHTPELHQRTSQLASCRRLAETLRSTGSPLSLHEFDGGHDPVCWGAELESALRWVIAD